MNVFVRAATLSLKRLLRRFRVFLLPFIAEDRKEGYCNCCGRESQFLKRRGSTPANSLECRYCGATSRYRAIALHLANYMQNGIMPEDTEPRLSLPTCSPVRHVSIYDTSYKSHLYRWLRSKSDLVMSEYLLQGRNGEALYGIRNEDLCRLQFGDNTFDLVVTSEVMEHVGDPWLGFSEIFRVLKRGGCHVFTTPREETQPTRVRAEFIGGKFNHLLPPKYHKDPLTPKGALVVTDFGDDFIDRLSLIGFETRVHHYGLPSLGILETTIFISRKP